MKKKVLISENQLKQIINFVSEQIQTKTLPATPHTNLENIKPTQNTIKSNNELLDQLQNKKIISDVSQLGFNANDKDFLSKISKFIQDKGFTPYLNVNTDQRGINQSVNPGISFSVPKLGVDLFLEPGYFGVSKQLPFLKDITIGAGYVPGSSSGNDVSGYRSTADQNSLYHLTNKFNFNLTIPIGK